MNQEVNLAVHMPRGMFGREDAVRRQLAQAEEIGVSHVWVGNFRGAGPCPGNGYVYPRRVQPEYFQHSLRRMV